MTAAQAGSLRIALARHEAARGKRYPSEIKARVIEFARSRRSAGASWMQISDELGVCFETLRRWCVPAAPVTTRAMVPVRVVDDGRERKSVTLLSPAGYRLEGLTLIEAVTALRALG